MAKGRACLLELVAGLAVVGTAASLHPLGTTPPADSEVASTRSSSLQLMADGVGRIEFNGRGDLMAVIAGGVGQHPGPIKSLFVETGREIGELTGCAGKLTGGHAVSDDGDLIAYGVCSYARSMKAYPADSVELWSLRTVQPITSFSVSSLCGIAFTPDGRELIEGRDPSTIEYRDIASGRISRRLEVSGGFSYIERAGPEFLLLVDRRVGSSGACGPTELRSLATGAVVVSSLGPADQSIVLTMPKKPLIATLSPDWKSVVVRSLPDMQTVRTVSVDYEAIWRVAISPDAEFIAVLSYDKPRKTWVDLFSLKTGEHLHVWEFGVFEANVVAFVPGEHTLAVGTQSGRVAFLPFSP